MWVIECLFVTFIISLVRGECLKSDEQCEFHLNISQRITMMNGRDLVYAANGKLYRYDVTNMSNAAAIEDSDVISADGWGISRLVTVANGMLPGPDIIVYEGQTIVVHVKNKLTSGALTIHWHGIHHRNTTHMDGVPYITQCPIQPGQTFRYEFKAEPKGTFWWHSHIGTQTSMGVYGALIIKDHRESNVEEHTMQIQDWVHDYDADTGFAKVYSGFYNGRKKLARSHSLDGSLFTFGEIQSGLINGKGRYYDPQTGDSNYAPLTVFRVTQGKKYRFRVIGTSALYPFRISIDNHTLTVVASDGNDLEPIVAESFVIYPAERYDFEIMADKPVANYWVRAVTLERDFYHKAEAILRYTGAKDEDPTSSRKLCTQQDPCLVLNCPFTSYPVDFTECKTFGQMKALAMNDPVPEYREGKFQEFFLNFGFLRGQAAVNGRTFDTPDVNLLKQPSEWHSPCQEPECGEERHCKCTHTLHIGNGDTVQFVFTNMGTGKGLTHPVHMHGHAFYVVKMGYGQYNSSTGEIVADNYDINCRGNPDREVSYCNNPTWSNSSWLNGNVPGLELERPPRKDTIIVPTGGYVVVRITADNPGLWSLHCHWELHNIIEMALLLNESYSEITPPPNDFPECYSYPPKIPRPVQDSTKQSESDDDMIEVQTFWVVFGVMAGIVLLQFFMLLAVYSRSSNRRSLQNYNFEQSKASIQK